MACAPGWRPPASLRVPADPRHARDARSRDPAFPAIGHLTFIDVTGLIYVAIVALWAAVLIPMWLRRHDDDQARRIERHRVAMGTLARIGDDADAAQIAAARRRRLVLAASATVGALGSVAWIAGFVPGLLAAALWLPFLAYLPAAVVFERSMRRAAAERALQERRERRAERDRRRVGGAAPRDDQARHDVVTVDVPAPVRREYAPHVAWDEVFDQTA